MLRPTRPARIARWALPACLLVLVGCGRGVEVTPGSLAQARQRWKQANVRNYNLEWTNTGLMNGHYRVAVRGREVRSVETVLPDGRVFAAPTAEPKAYGVEGLFVVIDEELAQLKTDAPFGQPKGTKVVLRFTPDPTYGYPTSYRRDVLGTPRSVAIDVIRFDPDPPPDTPAPPP
jgi:hypothetical protein